MEKEFETIVPTHLQHVNGFLVRLRARSTHIHRELEMGLVLEGMLTLQTQQGSARVGPGEVYLVNRMEPHSFEAGEGGALLIAIQFSTKLTQGFQAPGSHYRYWGDPNLSRALDPESDGVLKNQCIDLVYYFLRQEPVDEFRCFRLCAEVFCLLHEKLRWQALEYEDYSAIKQRANRMMAITDYIDQNFQRKLLLREIAQREDLSLTYLSHFFKDVLGMSFQQYLNQKRFAYACNLLFTTDRSILDISLSSGFSDVRYFNEAFAAQYGCSPRQYRKQGALPSAAPAPEQTNQYIYPREQALMMLEALREKIPEKKGSIPADVML